MSPTLALARGELIAPVFPKLKSLFSFNVALNKSIDILQSFCIRLSWRNVCFSPRCTKNNVSGRTQLISTFCSQRHQHSVMSFGERTSARANSSKNFASLESSHDFSNPFRAFAPSNHWKSDRGLFQRLATIAINLDRPCGRAWESTRHSTKGDRSRSNFTFFFRSTRSAVSRAVEQVFTWLRGEEKKSV